MKQIFHAIFFVTGFTYQPIAGTNEYNYIEKEYMIHEEVFDFDYPHNLTKKSFRITPLDTCNVTIKAKTLEECTKWLLSTHDSVEYHKYRVLYNDTIFKEQN